MRANPIVLTDRDVERFLSKVHFKPGCWLWLGSHFQTTGYGIFNLPGSDGLWRPRTAHRVAYEVFIGPLPLDLEVDHTCRNRGCVRHLEAVTHRENGLRGESPAAKRARQTHCKDGHEFTENNTHIRRGKRECITCRRIYERERSRRRRREGSGV